MAKKPTFVLNGAEFLAAVHNFTEKECSHLIKSLCENAVFEKVSRVLSDKVQQKFLYLQEGIDANNVKYAEICEKRKANGFKGGRPKKAKDNQPVSNNTEKTPNKKPDKEEEKGKEEESVFIKNNKNKGAETVDNFGFVGAPSVEDVADYAQSSGYTIDPIAFVNWHAERGWRHGKKYMAVDWQKAVRKWYCKENGLSMDEMESMSDICSGILSKVKVVQDDDN